MSKPPFNRLSLAPPTVDATRAADGSIILRSGQELRPHARSLIDLLDHWAAVTPSATFLAERDAAGAWREMSYGAAAAAASAIGQWLIDHGADPERPLCILSENGIDHALLMLGAMAVGIPVSAISTAYSVQSQDHGKLKQIVSALTPGVVYASDGARYGKALGALRAARLLDGVAVVTSGGSAPGLEAASFSALTGTVPTPAFAARRAAIGPATIAKVLFTSGSTGAPKGVINTQRMLCANQQALTQLWPFLNEKPPVILDWLPWSHTFGGNHNFNLILSHGGTLYIDEGKPAPGLIERTVANLREVSPTIMFNVPRGYDMLLPFLERDPSLRDSLCRNLDLLFYAGAALPQPLWERLEAVAVAARGERITMVSSWGSTETAPMATCVHFPIERAGIIGAPAPGNEVKLVPHGDRYEMRVRGACVTPGYWRRPELDAEAFDAEGFYRMGDAGRLADPGRPESGLVFDGRLAEDFKLTSGTWVRVGSLRVALVAALAPYVADAVITGHDGHEAGALLFPNLAAMRALCPELPPDCAAAHVLAHENVRQAIAAGLRKLADEGAGSAARIARAALVEEPPSIDANEITDKGYINQRAVLTRRAATVAALHADAADLAVIKP